MGSIKGKPRGKYNTRKLPRQSIVICESCKKSFKRLPILEHHIKSVHLNYRTSCSVCQNQFITASNLRRHLKNVHQIKDHSELNFEFAPIAAADTPPPSEAIVEKVNRAFGNHLVANREILAGEVIFDASAFAEIDYLSCTDPGNCFTCGCQLSTTKIQCQNCIEVWFCSNKCSSNRFHRQKCNSFHVNTDCRAIRLVTEIINIASKRAHHVMPFIEFCEGILNNRTRDKYCQTPFSDYVVMLKLKGKEGDGHRAIAERAKQLVKNLPQFQSIVDSEQTIFNMSLRHAASLELNSFAEENVVSKGGTLHRFAIYSRLSRFNHSCDPNINHVIDDYNVTHCIAGRAIKKGEQLFIDYFGGTFEGSDDERRREIKENWGFDCKCNKCEKK